MVQYRKANGEEPDFAADHRKRDEVEIAMWEARSRRYARHAIRYRRLSRGQHPFRSEPEITTEDMRSFDAALVKVLVEAGA